MKTPPFIPFYEPYQLSHYSKYVSSQVSSGWVGPGNRVREFEELLAEKTGAKYAVATNSGTSALMAAIWALTYPKERCLIPAYGYPAAANAVVATGRKAVFEDVAENGTLSPQNCEVALAVCIRHNGQQFDTEWKTDFIIDDSAVAIGIPFDNLGICRTFSFSVPKLITTGQGGAVITDYEYLANAIRDFIDQGGKWRDTRIHSNIGLNLRMSDINAALGIPQMKRLDELVSMRKRIRTWFRKHIDIGPLEDAWCVTYQHKDAERMKKHLHDCRIDSKMLYKHGS